MRVSWDQVRSGLWHAESSLNNDPVKINVVVVRSILHMYSMS